jgi:hypothetical protein
MTMFGGQHKRLKSNMIKKICILSDVNVDMIALSPLGTPSAILALCAGGK